MCDYVLCNYTRLPVSVNAIIDYNKRVIYSRKSIDIAPASKNYDSIGFRSYTYLHLQIRFIVMYRAEGFEAYNNGGFPLENHL